MTSLAATTWPEAASFAPAGAVLLVPVGSTEQHGPHLPLTTDTEIAVALVTAAVARDRRFVGAPPVAYGASGEHQDFAGTLSIGTEATEVFLVELGRSALHTFEWVVFVSTHGGNADAVRRALGAFEDAAAGDGRVRGVVAALVRGPARRAHRDVADARHRTRAGPLRTAPNRARSNRPGHSCRS